MFKPQFCAMGPRFILPCRRLRAQGHEPWTSALRTGSRPRPEHWHPWNFRSQATGVLKELIIRPFRDTAVAAAPGEWAV